MSCFKCDLHFNRIHELDGIGDINSSIAFLFDYPRAYESKKGVSFSNRVYKQLFIDLDLICGINTSNAYFTYLLKCPVDKTHMDHHKNYEVQTHNCSEENLELSSMPNVKLIVLVGAFTFSYIGNIFSYNVPSFKKVVNTTMLLGDVSYHCMYHPIFLKHNDDVSNDYNTLIKAIRDNVNPYHKLF